MDFFFFRFLEEEECSDELLELLLELLELLLLERLELVLELLLPLVRLILSEATKESIQGWPEATRSMDSTICLKWQVILVDLLLWLLLCWPAFSSCPVTFLTPAAMLAG